MFMNYCRQCPCSPQWHVAGSSDLHYSGLLGKSLSVSVFAWYFCFTSSTVVAHWLFDHNSVYKNSHNYEHCFLHGLECWSKTHLTWMCGICLSFFQQNSLQFFFLSRFLWAFCNCGSLEINFRCEITPMLVLLPDFSSSGRSSLKLPPATLGTWGSLAWEHLLALQICSSYYFF